MNSSVTKTFRAEFARLDPATRKLAARAGVKGGTLYWFWIGHHKVYDRLIRGL